MSDQLSLNEYKRETQELATLVDQLQHKIDGHKAEIKLLRGQMDDAMLTLTKLCITGERPVQKELFDEEDEE